MANASGVYGIAMVDALNGKRTVTAMAEYIDRDEAIKHITSKYDECLSVEDAIEEIDAIAAADVAPVKHGRWIDDKGLYKCSACNHLWSELWWTANCPIERMLKTMPYCPNCGAQMMDGDENV